ncbi:hypothetical protein [Trueperella pyogenes]|uniref:hypothetical protein n=1 Tax=Trueperella pyogenes TaxID=1661 RepID=UPI000E076075|nr:hypothetical protein [Trueperella pyogenes]MBB3025712.1 hypothetical protein [Trueperella pyogenes]SUO88356.1 Uncharacterised protein [Trueperella pyogenes]
MLKARLRVAQEEVDSMQKLLNETQKEKEKHDSIIKKQFENNNGNYDNETTVRLSEKYAEQKKELESRTKDLEKLEKHITTRSRMLGRPKRLSVA